MAWKIAGVIMTLLRAAGVTMAWKIAGVGMTLLKQRD